MQLLGYNIDTVLPEIVSGNKLVINTINPHSYCVAKEDELIEIGIRKIEFEEAFEEVLFIDRQVSKIYILEMVHFLRVIIL